MPRIGKYPFFCKRFFRRARKIVGCCAAVHFWGVVTSLASMQGRRSLSGMSRLTGRTRQSIAYFLEKMDWDAPELLRAKAADTLKQLRYRPGDPLYVILDDTQKRKRGQKMQAVSKIFLHSEKVFARGHTVVGCVLVYRGVIIPYSVALWASQQACADSREEKDPANRLTFRKLTQLAADQLAAVKLPAKAHGIALFDSYYLCPPVLKACQDQHFPYVSVVKKNRNFAPDGRSRDKRKIGQYGRNVLGRFGGWHQVQGKPHRLAERVGHLSKAGRVKLVFSRRPGETAWVALVTNHLEWSALTIVRHYLQRWSIEVFFKMSKQYLGLGDYQMLRYRGVVRYLHLVLIAYLLLTHLALNEPGAQAEIKEGKKQLRLPGLPQLQEKLRQLAWKTLIDNMEKRPNFRRAARKLQKELVL